MIIDARWEMYRIFLEEHSEYQNIFLTDTRDVIFQGNLFSKYSGHEIFLVYAAEALQIKDDPGNCNQKWLRHLFGETEYQRIADKIIICCGTVYATRAEMIILIENMIEILKRSTIWGDEQAAMNYLVHNKILAIGNIIESNVNNGEIFTVGLVKNPKISSERILREDGGVPAVIHQYDRHTTLMGLVNEIYRDKYLQPNKNFTDVSSVLDQMFCLIQRQNFSSATKFFVDYVLYAENLNPYGEKLLKLYQFIFQRYNSDAEILISAIQKTLVTAFAVGMNFQQLEKLYQLLVSTEKNVHFVNSSFKNFIKSMLMNFTEILYVNKQQNFAREYIKRLIDWRD